MTPSPQPSPPAPLQLVVHRKWNIIMQVVGKRGRTFVCSWFPGDPKAPGAKLRTDPFWEHQLNFELDAVRRRAKELGLGEKTPDPGAGNV